MLARDGQCTGAGAAGDAESEEEHSIDSTERMVARDLEGEGCLGPVVSCEVGRLVLERMGGDVAEEGMRGVGLQLQLQRFVEDVLAAVQHHVVVVKGDVGRVW